jgi:hypothetical protein
MSNPSPKQEAAVPPYAIGPFAFDGDKITLAPGTYVLTLPVTVRCDDSTSFNGVTYTGLSNSNADGAPCDGRPTNDRVP